jgi:hypothetical protein
MIDRFLLSGNLGSRARNISTGLILAVAASRVVAQPAPVAPFKLSIFAQSVPGSYTQPDSIAVNGSHVFIGFGNGVAKDGTDGKSSTIVEYGLDGTKVQTFSVLGHNDGLKFDPATGLLWALENEDGNPSLIVIDTNTGNQTTYSFPLPTPHGGGYDDIVFRNGTVYLTASNPQSNPNTAPAVVSAQLSGTSVVLTPVLMGNDSVTNITTGSSATLNLQDPDSMILAPNGDLIVDSQADDECVIIQNAGGTAQAAFLLPFSSGGTTAMMDDTVFATVSNGFLLVSDLSADTIYRVDALYWPSGAAYSAGQIGAAAVGFVGQLDFVSGNLTPIVNGMNNPRGMAFVDQKPAGFQGGRFTATVTWATTDGRTGTGQAISVADNTTGYWFFTPDNVDLTVKVLDGTAINGHFWVFYGSLSNVAFTLIVTDTQTGTTKTYMNPQGQLASFADTSAF